MPRRSPFLLASAAAAALMVGLTAIAPASAHAIWFAQRARQLALIFGVGADDLDAVSRLKFVTLVKGYDQDWRPVKTSLRAAGAIPVVDSDKPVAAITAVMDYGDWTKDKSGRWHNKGKDEVANAAVSEHTWKYALHFEKLPAKEVPLLEGLVLQLVPVGPIPLEKGKPLTVRASFNGKSMEGVQVMTDYINDPDEIPVRTGADGTATITLRNQGLNVLMGIYVSPSDRPAKYDRVEYRSSLSFVLPHASE
ncbi:protein of unknown function [Novosphingobium sp. CF614]|uniref:DUF4198 domain-containing protein n=1 Tax=Novosphingobium sp. CF614 TaxID=1884364 RepID=UPI0008F08EF0|nr:DUF4198 domain-containing protein [Novosphingobium sp. CF614]SFF99866.1 protein of unknown function [Novosphingobium sp. CF614]